MMPHVTATVEIQEQAALFNLELLAPVEASRFESHVRRCAVCAAELRAYHEVMVEVALSQPEAAPPARLRDEILRRASSFHNRPDAMDCQVSCRHDRLTLSGGARKADLKD